MLKHLLKSVILLLCIMITHPVHSKLPDEAPPLPPPSGTIVTVSTWQQLTDAVWNLQSNTTIIVEPGIYTIPEWWFINVGIDQQNAIDNIAIRGATGNFNDVIIRGTTPGMYGASSFGFFINNATNVTIADLTVGEVAHHAVQINPPAIGAADGIRLYHCRFYDCGEQIIKGNFLFDDEGLPAGVRNGFIEYCLIEYTAWGPQDGYTEGIDLHACENWTIRHNLLKNIRVPENPYHTHVPAILIWNNSKNVQVLSNVFINCDRGVAFGLVDQTTYSGFAEVNTGLICNNMIYRQTDSVFYHDAGILAWDVRNVSIIHNTILDENFYYPPIEYRFVKENSHISIVNNLVNPTTYGFAPPVWDRDGSGYQNAVVHTNFTEAGTEMFRFDYPADLHLHEEYAGELFGIEANAACLNDFDDDLRNTSTHYGADHSGYNASEVIATHSFTNYDGGTHPNTVTIAGNQIIVDLSAIAGATVYRAAFNPGRNFNYYNVTENPFYESTMALSCNSESLVLMPPRYHSFEASEAVISQLLSGNLLTITVENQGAGFGSHVSLDVMCNIALPTAIQQVTNAEARFINGDAFITFLEVNTPIAEEEPIYPEFSSTYQNVMQGNIRYRIYRSATPLNSSQDIVNAQLIDEIYPLSGWNPELEGPERVFPYTWLNGIVTRLPVENGVLADVGTGIYVNRYKGGENGENVWYFISHTVDGAEDFSAIIPGMNLTGRLDEIPGSGVVLLSKSEQTGDFVYEGATTLNYYVKWECPPASSFPNEASNYLVCLRNNINYTSIQPGVSLKLHCWGGNLSDNCGWWYYADQGYIMVSANQFPWQNWWIGHHSSLGTLKSYNHGTVQPFTPFRLMNFICDFLRDDYNIDTNKIMLSGASMGGSGTSMLGLRNGQLFANLNSWVGVHNPGNTPVFEGSYELALGDSAWHCNFSNVDFTAKYGGIEVKPEDNYDVWEYFDNAKWLDAHPKAEIPWHTFSNGVNDNQIGWPQALEFVTTLQNHKAPFNFTWGQNGHSQRAMVLAPYGYESDWNSRILFRKNQSFPVFSNASLNNNLINDAEGQINNFFFWDTESIKDTTDRWEVNISLSDHCSFNAAMADITPRRLQHFTVVPGADYAGQLYENETLLACDTATADAYGRVTFNNLEITKNIRKLVITGISNQTINIPAGWSGISSYIIPSDNDIATLFEGLEPSLIYLGNQTGCYIPELGINTLDWWDTHSGYVIKTTESSLLTINGNPEMNVTVELQEGWNLIPVLCKQNVSAEALFAPLSDRFQIAVDVAGSSVYWPQYQIATLVVLQAGESYFVKVNQPSSITFPTGE